MRLSVAGRTRPAWSAVLWTGSAAVVAVGALVLVQVAVSDAKEELPPPAAKPVTVLVEERVVSQTLQVSGTAEREHQVVLAAKGVTADDPVITAQPGRIGGAVKNGTTVFEISGRPLVVLAGTVPAYRDLRPGSHGKDVAQLQVALRRQGHAPQGIADGKGYFGADTAAAVERFYRDHGYSVPLTDPAYSSRVASLYEAAQEALRRHLAALREGRKAKPDDAGDALADTTRALRDARKALREYLRVNGPFVPRAEISFQPVLPAVLTRRTGEVGDPASAATATLASGQMIVRAEVDAADADSLRAGLRASLSCSGTAVRGQVGRVMVPPAAGDPPAQGTGQGTGAAGNSPASGDTGSAADGSTGVTGAQGSSGPQSRPGVVIKLQSPPRSLAARQPCVGAVVVASTKGKVPAVPVTALFTGTDGEVSVHTLEGGTVASRRVEVGLVANGWAELAGGASDVPPGTDVVVSADAAAP